MAKFEGYDSAGRGLNIRKSNEQYEVDLISEESIGNDLWIATYKATNDPLVGWIDLKYSWEGGISASIVSIELFKSNLEPLVKVTEINYPLTIPIAPIEAILGGADDIYGTKYHDSIRGFRGADELFGGKGNDRLYGNGGRDTLVGEKGRDFLSGGSGNDILLGEQGNDTLIGGKGADRFVFDTYNGSIDLGDDVILDFEADKDSIIIEFKYFFRLKVKQYEVDGEDVTEIRFGGNSVSIIGQELNRFEIDIEFPF